MKLVNMISRLESSFWALVIIKGRKKFVQFIYQTRRKLLRSNNNDIHIKKKIQSFTCKFALKSHRVKCATLSTVVYILRNHNIIPDKFHKLSHLYNQKSFKTQNVTLYIYKPFILHPIHLQLYHPTPQTIIIHIYIKIILIMITTNLTILHSQIADRFKVQRIYTKTIQSAFQLDHSPDQTALNQWVLQTHSNPL